jgi:hypothetical protein
MDAVAEGVLFLETKLGACCVYISHAVRSPKLRILFYFFGAKRSPVW